MKRSLQLFLLAFLCFFYSNTKASTVPSVSHQYPDVKVSQFLELSAKEIERLTGERMSLLTKISFGLLKKKMRKAARKDPHMTVSEFMNSRKKMKTWLLVVLIVVGVILVAFIIFGLAYSGAI